MASFSLPSAQPGHGNQPENLKLTMGEKEEQEKNEQSEASVEGPKPSVMKLRWTRVEYTMLLKHICVHGAKHWKLISDQLPGRSPSSCRMRWVGQLRPKFLKYYNEMKQKSQAAAAAAAAAPPKPNFTIRGHVSYMHFLTRVMNRFMNRMSLATSYMQQQESASYEPQPLSPSPPPPPPPPPSPSSPPKFIDFLGVGSE